MIWYRYIIKTALWSVVPCTINPGNTSTLAVLLCPVVWQRSNPWQGVCIFLFCCSCQKLICVSWALSFLKMMFLTSLYIVAVGLPHTQACPRVLNALSEIREYIPRRWQEDLFPSPFREPSWKTGGFSSRTYWKYSERHNWALILLPFILFLFVQLSHTKWSKMSDDWNFGVFPSSWTHTFSFSFTSFFFANWEILKSLSPLEKAWGSMTRKRKKEKL